MKNKVVLAFSGGMDSSVLLHMASQSFNEVYTLVFDYNQRHKRELKSVYDQIEDVYQKTGKHIDNKFVFLDRFDELFSISSLTNTNIDLPNINEIAGDAQPTSYVPFRNLMFLSMCCARAESVGADTVWYGATGVDGMAGYWDADKHFIKKANELIGLNRKHKIVIEAPLIDMDKVDIINKGIELNVDFAKTWTCYSCREDGLADATTPSSSLRIKGFIDAGYRDPIKYAQQDAIENLYEQCNCKDI